MSSRNLTFAFYIRVSFFAHPLKSRPIRLLFRVFPLLKSTMAPRLRSASSAKGSKDSGKPRGGQSAAVKKKKSPKPPNPPKPRTTRAFPVSTPGRWCKHCLRIEAKKDHQGIPFQIQCEFDAQGAVSCKACASGKGTCEPVSYLIELLMK